MRDLIRVRIIGTNPHKSPIDEKEILTPKLESYEPLVLRGKEVGFLYATITNEDTKEPWGWRQAQVRYALGLTPTHLDSETLQVPHFSPSELQRIMGKDLLVSVDKEDVPTLGIRIRVLDFYKLREEVNT